MSADCASAPLYCSSEQQGCSLCAHVGTQVSFRVGIFFRSIANIKPNRPCPSINLVLVVLNRSGTGAPAPAPVGLPTASSRTCALSWRWADESKVDADSLLEKLLAVCLFDRFLCFVEGGVFDESVSLQTRDPVSTVAIDNVPSTHCHNSANNHVAICILRLP